MEKPQETYKRLFDECSLRNGDRSITMFDFAKIYHKERLKIELPTDAEIKEQFYIDKGMDFQENLIQMNLRMGAHWIKNKLISHLEGEGE